jgi:hypothetical protein
MMCRSMKEIEERVLRVHCCTSRCFGTTIRHAKCIRPRFPFGGQCLKTFSIIVHPPSFHSGEEKKRSEACLSANCWSCLSTRVAALAGRAKCWCRRPYGISSPGPGLAFEERGLQQLKGVPQRVAGVSRPCGARDDVFQ